jgi:flagellar basal-body rod protein FlgB
MDPMNPQSPKNPLFNRTFDILSELVSFRSERHKAIVSNVANIDTPGYEPRDLAFKSVLDSEKFNLDLARTNEKHLPGAEQGGKYIKYKVTAGEGVSLDKEMVNLAENHLKYTADVELLARKFRGIETVLKETK